MLQVKTSIIFDYTKNLYYPQSQVEHLLSSFYPKNGETSIIIWYKKSIYFPVELVKLTLAIFPMMYTTPVFLH